MKVARLPGKIRISLTACLFALAVSGVTAKAVYAQACLPLPPYATEADRIGFNVYTDDGKTVFDYYANFFGAGWFIDYRPRQYIGPNPPPVQTDLATDTRDRVLLPLVSTVHPNMHDMAYLHLLRGNDLNDTWRTLVGNLVDRYPGLVLVVGNEPDRVGLQDDMTPSQYARVYHDVYTFVKQRDPTALVAIAGVVQPTPLRIEYLNRVLNSYRTQFGHDMPVDVWTVHAFILREIDPADAETPYENWGAGIPPGLSDAKNLAIRYKVNQHGDINIFKQNIIDFRKWMRDRGYRNTPLLVTEYGILMRPDYEAPDGGVYDHEFVRDYMFATFDFFRRAQDASYGYPADGNRLVQAWSWFALNNVVDTDNSGCCNGNLLNHDTRAVTLLGQDFAAYTAAHGAGSRYTDLSARAAVPTPAQVAANTANQSVAVAYSVTNRGNVVASGARIRFFLGDPDNGGTLLATRYLSESLSPRCREIYEGEATLRLPALSQGTHTLTLQLLPQNGNLDPVPGNNKRTFTLRAVAP